MTASAMRKGVPCFAGPPFFFPSLRYRVLIAAFIGGGGWGQVGGEPRVRHLTRAHACEPGFASFFFRFYRWERQCRWRYDSGMGAPSLSPPHLSSSPSTTLFYPLFSDVDAGQGSPLPGTGINLRTDTHALARHMSFLTAILHIYRAHTHTDMHTFLLFIWDGFVVFRLALSYTMYVSAGSSRPKRRGLRRPHVPPDGGEDGMASPLIPPNLRSSSPCQSL